MGVGGGWGGKWSSAGFWASVEVGTVLDEQRWREGKEEETKVDEGGNGSLIRLFVVQWGGVVGLGAVCDGVLLAAFVGRFSSPGWGQTFKATGCPPMPSPMKERSLH